jgi:hypothetical protein
MRKFVTSGSLVLLLMTAAIAAKADTFTTSTPGVDFAMNNGGFYVSQSALPESFPNGSNFWELAAQPGDAGIVLYFGGGLTLGELQDVSVTTDNAAMMNVNLWLDTGGDGKFFDFTGDLLNGLNGDSYAGTGGTSVDSNSPFYMLGGNGGGNTYTLGQLIAGVDAGINGNTPVALWIGVNSPGVATISQVDVLRTDPAATPEPSSIFLLGTGFLGLAGAIRRTVA